MKCREKAVLDCTGLIMGCLGEETKAEKGRGLGDLRDEKTHRKTEL